MTPITDFDTLLAQLRRRDNAPRVVVVYPHDTHTQEAVEASLAEGIARFTLVGQEALLKALPCLQRYAASVDFVDCSDADTAAVQAVEIVRATPGSVLMKGLIHTDQLLHAVLDKQHGLLPAGGVLSHITATEIPGRSRLLFFSDAAVIPQPTLAQRTAMLGEMAAIIRRFGIEKPRIALTHFTEEVNPKFPVSEDYVQLCRMAAEGRFGSVIVDGPMDLRCALDEDAAAIKGIKSPIGGRADALMMADLEAGNTLYKATTTLARGLNAGMLMGTTAPVVLPSRCDTERSKLCSLAMACHCA